MKRALILGGILFCSACTHVDTGQVDYRIADGPETSPPERANRSECSSAPTQADYCDPLIPVRIDRRYQPDNSDYGRQFAVREVYAIDIDQGMIGTNLLEGNVLGRQFGHVGEFAVLANVFEFAGSESDAAQRRFLESGEYSSDGEDPSDVELKLVYYSDDVRRGQPFGFSHIPLRPRTVYNGGAIGIQIVVIETDVRSGPLGSLLTTLARFGQQAIPGPTETTDLLFDLGESLFSGTTGSDDRLFEYRFVLAAPTSDRTAVRPTFAPGHYILRRAQDRTTPINWNNVRFDHNTGRLFRFDGEYRNEVRDEMYLVLNISRYPEGTAPEFYSHQTWPQFRELLQQAADTADAPLNQITERVGQAVAERRSTQWRNQLQGQWSAIERWLRIRASATVDNLDALQAELANCQDTRNELLAVQQASDRAVQEAVVQFIGDYTAATLARGTPSVSELDAADRNALISRIARYFMPWAPETGQKFADAAAFDTAFGGTNASELARLGLDTARTRGRQASGCADLLQGVPRV